MRQSATHANRKQQQQMSKNKFHLQTEEEKKAKSMGEKRRKSVLGG